MKKQLALMMLPLFMMASAPSGAYQVDTSSRVVAFGDVHGAYDDWVALLRELKVVDDKLDWSAGSTHLVSLGDLIDRGPGSRQVVELLQKLDSQAVQAGGRVHMVLGNHEVMVLTGDLRYVSAAEFSAFADDESEVDREQAFADYRRFHPNDRESAVRADFDSLYPRGYFALRAAYATDGPLGQWLLKKPFAVRVNDRVYVHAGIADALAEHSIEALNAELHDELDSFLSAMNQLRAAGVMPWHVGYHDRLDFLNARAQEFAAANANARADWFKPLQTVFDLQRAMVFSDDSPVWYRGTAVCHPYSESFNTERFLKRADARQLVIGHTPSRGDVIERMDGQVLRLDTGMLSSVYGGRAAALVVEGDRSYVHYLGSSEKAAPAPERRSLSARLSGMSDADLEDFMRTAPVTNIEDIGTGITRPKRVTQQRGEVINDAVFKYEDTHPNIQSKASWNSRRYRDSDRYVYDVAAYKLDRLLDLQMVPTAVQAEVDGRSGALSDWASNTINERDRLAQDVPFGGYCEQYEQYRLRFVFDILIYNEDRNLTNILWDRDDFSLLFIDHSLAFRVSDKRPKQYRKVDLEVSDVLRSRLEALQRSGLDEALSAYLHPRQIAAILERRNLILDEAVSTSP